MKVMTIIGTRPEIIKLSRIMAVLDQYTDHVLVHTGQNYDYELNEIFFSDLGVRKPDYFLDAAGETAAETVGNVIAKADEVIGKEKPDAMLILGDTNSSLTAYPAKRRKVPVFHMEAGNRCFDERVPEEINRRIVDHISDINLPYTEHARRYLLAEGIRPETVIRTGSPVREVLLHYASQINDSDVLARLQLEQEGYILVSAHREENIDSPEQFDNFLVTLQTMAAKFNKKTIVSTHPRTRNRLDSVGGYEGGERVNFMKPLGFFDYNRLQQHAFCVVSDSGTITEESSILNFPAVTIRNAHERPEGMDEGVLIMCGLKPANVVDAINVVTSQHDRQDRQFQIPVDYRPDNVSKKIVRIIMSYTDYVNRTVWRK